MKKIIAAHDLSGLGKASLGAVIPIISSMGSVVCSLPTAVLSTITGVFDNFTIVDLTEQMKKTITHWKDLDIKFDYIYSGFLGSPQQVDVIISATESFSECYVVVDPVFADNGKLYPTMNDEMVENMKRLVAHANLITPNITEAQFLLNEKNCELTESVAKDWLKRLCEMGPDRVVITSCRFGKDMYVTAYEKNSNQFWKLKCDYVPIDFHGTGDVFTSVLVGALSRGDGFEYAITQAAEFVKNAIDETLKCEWESRFGILIEKVLDKLRFTVTNKCERF